MDYKIGSYIERKMKLNQITKVELHKRLKEVFHSNEKYVLYKAFASRFYGKFYAQDLFQISYLLRIDLNKMRDELMGSKGLSSDEQICEALKVSKYINEAGEGLFSKWTCIDGDDTYIVWFRATTIDDIEMKVEMYNKKTKELVDISYLTYWAITTIEKDWSKKTLDEKMHIVKTLNRNIYNMLNSEMEI